MISNVKILQLNNYLSQVLRGVNKGVYGPLAVTDPRNSNDKILQLNRYLPQALISKAYGNKGD